MKLAPYASVAREIGVGDNQSASDFINPTAATLVAGWACPLEL
jgi:hypothetical protein